jgi:hypothetical protein
MGLHKIGIQRHRVGEMADGLIDVLFFWNGN